MAESTLTLTYDDLHKEVAFRLGFGRSIQAGDKFTLTDEIVQGGYRQFLFPPSIDGRAAHEWTFLKPVTTLTAWVQVGEASETVSSSGATLTSYSGASDADSDVFYASMVGKKVKINSLSGTDNGSPTFSATTGLSTITATSAIFTTSSDQVGGTIKFTTSGKSFVIAGVTNTTTITVYGDTTATTSHTNGAFTVFVEYTISEYTSARVVTLSATPNPAIANKAFSIAANGDYRLPDDFGGIDGQITFPPSTSYAPIRVTGEGEIRALRDTTTNTSTGRPQIAAIRPANTDQLSGQRFEMMVWPIPDQNYTFTFRYNALVNKLATGTADYPLGGMAHSETILASCLAVAEHRMDEKRGSEFERFVERLNASISVDTDANTQEYFGYNSNVERGTNRINYSDRHCLRDTTVTYKGVQY